MKILNKNITLLYIFILIFLLISFTGFVNSTNINKLNISDNNLNNSSVVNVAAVDFKQYANTNDLWINSILQQLNSLYFEGMSVPQRIVFSNIDPTVNDIHTLTLAHQATKGGIHSYDWLTSWNQGNTPPLSYVPWGENIGPAFSAALIGTLHNQTGSYEIFVDVPDDPFISKDGSTQTRINAYESLYGNRQIRICGNQPIISASFTSISHDVANGGDTGDSYIDYELTWNSSSDQILIELAGHLAISDNSTNSIGWGSGLGSGSISGGPYHFRIFLLDGFSLGAQDNQIKGSDIHGLNDTGCLGVSKIIDLGSVVNPGAINQTFEICISGPSYPTGNCTLINSSGYEWRNLIQGNYTLTETYPGPEWTVTLPGTIYVVAGSLCTTTSITNTYNPGCLEVEKIVDWNGFTPDAGQTFTVTVTGPSYPTGTINIFDYDGGIWTLNNLIAGTYWVNETNPGSNWVVTPGLSQSVTVIPGAPCATVSINNSFEVGCLEINKIVDFAGVINSGSISETFEICITGPSYPTGDCKIIDESGGTLTWNNLIPGTYTIAETDPGSEWIVTGDTSIIVNAGSSCATANITNTYKSGCLEIIKTVDWSGFTPDAGQTFNITVTGPSYPTGTSHTFGYTGGTWNLDNLIPGTYTIVETDPGIYWTVTPGLSQTITVNPGTPCATATITNTYDPCTELELEKLVWNGTAWTDNIRVPVGEFLDFKIIITNIGSKPATNITVTDTLASPQLEYRNQANHIPDLESSNLVIWSFDTITPGETIEITFKAETVHTCYGWNLVNVTTIQGCDSYEDLVIVKVVLDAQPIIEIKNQVWDGGKQEWVDSITRTVGSDLNFKLTLNSTALDTIYDIIITDDLPDILEYGYSSNYDEESVSDDLHQIIWHFDSIERGEIIEIFYDAELVEEGFGSNSAIIQASGFLYDIDTVFIQSIGQPLVQLSYPKGGEILSNTVNIEWFAIDSDDTALDIYLFYSSNNGITWMQIGDVFHNYDNEGHGQYGWDTTDVADGEYIIMVQAVNTYNGISYDVSEEFTVDNGNSGIKISDIEIRDTTIDSNKWVKNGDSITITAAITGHESDTITYQDITADLSGFGGNSNSIAESYDGFIARWTMNNIICNPTDGVINVKVKINNEISNYGTTTADNTKPNIEISHPKNGLYMLNRRFLPLMKTIIIGAITVEVDANDIAGIHQVEFYINDEHMKSVSNEPFNWNMNMKLMGQRIILKVIVYDSAGNTETTNKELKVFNIFGN